jgi:hypothetical protein
MTITICCEQMLWAINSNQIQVDGNLNVKGNHTATFNYCPWCGTALPFPVDKPHKCCTQTHP